MDKYVIIRNDKYAKEISTGGMIMHIPRVSEYSIVESEDSRLILNIADSLEDPLETAMFVCKKMNG